MINNLEIEKGNFALSGVQVCKDDIWVTSSFDDPQKECGICFYTADYKEQLKIEFDDCFRCGKLYALRLKGVPESFTCYSFFCGEEKKEDIYAKHVIGQNLYKLEKKYFDWKSEKKPDYAFSDMILYGLHVRGFTKHESSDVINKGTFLGVTEKISYLQKLGITSLEFMPVYEFEEKEKVITVKQMNSIYMICFNPVPYNLKHVFF